MIEKIIEAIQIIPEHGLAFRGENETIGSVNNGRYHKSKNYAVMHTLFLSAANNLNMVERATHASLALGHTLG